MGDDANREAVEGFMAALDRNDLDTAAGFLGNDFVEEWPQSRERIRGTTNWLDMAKGHPTFPSIETRRILGGGDIWVAEAEYVYPGDPSPWQVCSVIECRSGKIARITEYFGAAFEAADWRKDLVERL
jgi:ketosteroid isomerase-like protein